MNSFGLVMLNPPDRSPVATHVLKTEVVTELPVQAAPGYHPPLPSPYFAFYPILALSKKILKEKFSKSKSAVSFCYFLIKCLLLGMKSHKISQWGNLVVQFIENV